MNKHTIWKSFDLYTLDEDKDFIDFIKEEYPELEDEYALRYRAYEIINEYLEDDFGKCGNIQYSSLKNTPCVVSGSLGLWWGRTDIEPKQFDTIEQAIYACLEDSNEIWEDRYGNLHIEAYHHDGHNSFVLKKKTPKGLRTIHLRKCM